MSPAKKKKKQLSWTISLPVKIFLISTAPLLLAVLICFFYRQSHPVHPRETKASSQAYQTLSLEEAFLTPNEYSRPQKRLKKVHGIVIHYTANPGSDARANRDYFESLKDSHSTYASSHFIIGLDGTILQCIPLDEIAYASNDRNSDTISIECCHPDKSGAYTEATYQALLQLCVYLCQSYGLSSDDLIRHYDVTGKLCPKYYVEHPKKWEQLRQDVQELIASYDEK